MNIFDKERNYINSWCDDLKEAHGPIISINIDTIRDVVLNCIDRIERSQSADIHENTNPDAEFECSFIAETAFEELLKAACRELPQNER